MARGRQAGDCGAERHCDAEHDVQPSPPIHPKKKQPVTLTISVPNGNGAPVHLWIIAPNTKRDTLPAAPPMATYQIIDRARIG